MKKRELQNITGPVAVAMIFLPIGLDPIPDGLTLGHWLLWYGIAIGLLGLTGRSSAR